MITDILMSAKYLECGREFPNVDCYGIVLHVRKIKGLYQFPELGSAKKINGNIDHDGKPLASELSICKPKDGCIAACYNAHGAMTHTGVVVYDNGLKVIECNPVHNASCTPLSRFIRRFNKVEFFE